MSSILRVNTDDVMPSLRIQYWNDSVGSIYGGMSVDSKTDEFNAELLHVSLGQIGFMRAKSEHALARRSGNNSQTESLIFHFQVRGESINRQARKKVWLRPGELTICENRSSYSIEPSAKSDVVVIELPYSLARRHIPDIDRSIIQRFSSASTHGRLLFSILQTVESECRLNMNDDIELPNLEFTIMDLLSHIVKNPSETGAGGLCRTNLLLRKVNSVIQQNLSDDGLNTRLIAQQIGVSDRRIQTLFASVGITPTGYIRDRRLEWAADQLRSTNSASVTQIAFDAGYSDSAYFSRCFRKKFGVTPNRFRNP